MKHHPKTYKFIHRFATGVVISMHFNRRKHYDKATNRISPVKNFSREITDEEAPAMFPEYREWAHSVHSEIAKIIKHDCGLWLVDSYAKPPIAEFWIYRLDGTKELHTDSAWD